MISIKKCCIYRTLTKLARNLHRKVHTVCAWVSDFDMRLTRVLKRGTQIMQSTSEQKLELALIADDAYRIAMLHEAIRQAGLKCTVRRLAGKTETLAYLASKKNLRQSPHPVVVLFDFAEINARAMKFAKRLAFGPKRSRVPVIFLTSEDSESVLSRGDIDGGEATMFSPRSLASILNKLSDERRHGFLKAVTTLYRYGPILARQPRQVLDRIESRRSLEPGQETAALQ